MCIIVLPKACQCIMWWRNLFGKLSTNFLQVRVSVQVLGDLCHDTPGFHRQIPNPLSTWNPNWSCLDSSPFSEPQHLRLLLCLPRKALPEEGTPGFLPGSPVMPQHQSHVTIILSSGSSQNWARDRALQDQQVRSWHEVFSGFHGVPRVWTTEGKKILFFSSMFIIQDSLFHHF